MGIVVVVGSLVPAGTARVTVRYCSMTAMIMKRRIAKRFLGAVQRNIRRL